MSNLNGFSGVQSYGVGSGSVAETCNRLSRFIKESGSLGGLQLARKLEARGNETSDSKFSETLFDKTENPGKKPAKNSLMELFPQHAISSKLENETTPMTVFYGGQVFIFNNFPAEKIKDLTVLATGDTCPTSMPKPRVPTVGSDFPYMRTPSLYRFMEKRKDRIIARAPYKIHESPPSSSIKREEDLSLKL